MSALTMAALESAIEECSMPAYIYVTERTLRRIRRFDALGDRKLPPGPWAPLPPSKRSRYRRGREFVRPRQRCLR